jgi:hypothetical protein
MVRANGKHAYTEPPARRTFTLWAAGSNSLSANTTATMVPLQRREAHPDLPLRHDVALCEWTRS